MSLRPSELVPSWRNWAGNQHCSPASIERPLTEEQLQQVVVDAAKAGHRVRAVGAGHSFTAIAATDDVMVSLEHLNMVRNIDRTELLVTVQAGIELRHLNSRLANVGLAMTNLGDIAYQSLAGAVSTGTHGTGLAYTGLAGQIRGMRIITATGDIVECSAEQNAELFAVARVGLGVFGIVSEITIQVEKAFNLHAIEGVEPIGGLLENWLDEVASHDHFEFMWIPGTADAMTKRNRRTQDPIDPQSKAKHFADKILGENIAFGAVAKLAKVRPSMIPRLTKLVAKSVNTSEFIAESHRVFASPRWVKFVEMEYSVALADVPAIVQRIDDALSQSEINVLFPIEVRAAAADDIPLSTAHGRASGYIAVHRAKGLAFRQYFELVEAIMDEFNGRPHWGKMHFQDASTLAPRYSEWAEFQRVRLAYDPTGVFMNDYTTRVLGS